jgi:hypothetical protein
MGDKQTIMKFESLPNEIFVLCFEYLNAPDIFYAFEQLNPRFYRLIRNVPLRLNFEDIHKSIFDRFCEKMLDYTEIQQQIYSVKLSNEHTHGQIQAFFTYFSLNEFIQLRSLTLIEIKENNLEQLSSILPLLSQLTCLRLVRSLMTSDTLISKLPRCKPNILSTSSLNSTLSSFQEIIPLTKLSIKFGMLNQYYQILLDIPFLQYLNISRGLQFESVSSADISLLRGRVNHLKHLIIADCIMLDTNNLMDVIAHMINLRSLTVSVYENSDIINASRWQRLITSSLPHLNIFWFKFGTFDRNEIVKKYEEFQSDFWIVKHHWYTECLLAEGTISYIFTIPYLIDTRSMWLKCVRHSNTLVDNSKTFDNVTDLYSPGEELMKSNGFYFPNNRSLIIESLPVLDNEDDEQRFIRSLKRTMNLLNLKHLQIPTCSEAKGPTILLKILKEAPHLSSLNIHNCAIDTFKTNKEICRYTSEMIKKLQFGIYSRPHSCYKPHDVSSVHEVFPNIEEMTCSVTKPEECLLLLNNLPKLSKFSVNFLQYRDLSTFNAIKEELSKLKNMFFYEDIQYRNEHVARITFGFWVDRDS